MGSGVRAIDETRKTELQRTAISHNLIPRAMSSLKGCVYMCVCVCVCV